MESTNSSLAEEASFDKILSHPKLLSNLTEKMGFLKPTPIQAATAGPILQGANLVAGAKTGSGKTVAFLAPLCERLLKQELTKVLVLAPTRELVLQIDEEAMQLLDGQNEVVSVPVYGGVPIDGQILAIRHHKPRLVIATPGRVIDLVQEESIRLNEYEAIVLDEADRMSDMGFAPQVTQILDQVTNRKQSLFFSATLPKEVGDLMNKFCPNPVHVRIDKADESSETIEHKAIFCSRRDKINKVINLLSSDNVVALVFTKTRNGSDQVYRSISGALQNVGILHAGFPMNERERTIRAFRDGEIRILVATDVVSRGIDVDTITHVLHFDIPDSLEDYIHRSGRSGRAGRAGQTIAIFEADNRDQMLKYKQLQEKIKFEVIEGNENSSDFSDEDRGRNRHHRSQGSRRPTHSRAAGRGPRDHSQRRTKPPETRPTKTAHSSATSHKKVEKKVSLMSRAKKLIGKLFS